MSRKSLLTLAIFLGLLFAGSPLLLAHHAHDGWDDRIECTVCSFASTFVALNSPDLEIPVAPTPTVAIHAASQQVPIPESGLANSIRAPPPQFS